MIDLRTYDDILFRVDEVLGEKMREWLKFDERFFYDQNDFNRAFLAYTFDIEPKSTSLDETKELLKEPIKTYFDEGTFIALTKALKSLYSDTALKEWHEYGGEPYHFKLEFEASGKGIDFKTLAKSDEIVNAYKNVRSVYDGASVRLASVARIKAASVSLSGESVSVYPLQIENLQIRSKKYYALTFKFDETMEVKLDARIL
nr:MAG TPA: tail protein [Caudoviricetes sp.]